MRVRVSAIKIFLVYKSLVENITLKNSEEMQKCYKMLWRLLYGLAEVSAELSMQQTSPNNNYLMSA